MLCGDAVFYIFTPVPGVSRCWWHTSGRQGWRCCWSKWRATAAQSTGSWSALSNHHGEAIQRGYFYTRVSQLARRHTLLHTDPFQTVCALSFHDSVLVLLFTHCTISLYFFISLREHAVGLAPVWWWYRAYHYTGSLPRVSWLASWKRYNRRDRHATTACCILCWPRDCIYYYYIWMCMWIFNGICVSAHAPVFICPKVCIICLSLYMNCTFMLYLPCRDTGCCV